MSILIPDSSILNQLEYGGLLESAFSCGLTMVVPDFLYEKELEQENGAYLCKLGLSVVSLAASEMSLAQTIKTQCVALSNADCHALVCALRSDHALVAWNMNLSREASVREVKVLGLLWILDQMDINGQIESALLCEGLGKISARQRCLLPKDKVQSRLLKWKKKT